MLVLPHVSYIDPGSSHQRHSRRDPAQSAHTGQAEKRNRFTMKSVMILLCMASSAVCLPFNFGNFGNFGDFGNFGTQAGGSAEGTVTQGLSSNPHAGTSSQIVNTGSSATGQGGFGAPNFSNSFANNAHGPGGLSESHTGATSVQPGFGGAPFGGGFGGSPFGGFNGGFGGFGGQASGEGHGKVTEGQSFGPQGFSQIISTGSGAKGNSVNGAPSFSSGHASNVQGPGGTSVSNTGASSVQPGFSGGPFGGFGGFDGFGGF